MWVIMLLCISIFGAAIALLPEVTSTIFWKVMVTAAISCALGIVVFEVWLRRVIGRRDQAIQFLDRITSGDLSLSAREIADATRSERMASSLRALVSNLERTIRRFGQLATDVVTVSQQISGRSRVIARNDGRKPSTGSMNPGRCGSGSTSTAANSPACSNRIRETASG